MKAGDKVTDKQQKPWTIQKRIGRGIWGRSFLIHDDAGDRAVLKVALGKSDFRRAATQLAKVCNEAALEQANLLQGSTHPFLRNLRCLHELPNGRLGLFLTYYPNSLQSQMRDNAPLTSLIGLLERTTTVLSQA